MILVKMDRSVTELKTYKKISPQISIVELKLLLGLHCGGMS